MTPELVATYRFQLRDGVDLDAVAARIPWLVTLGVSHIYLAPIFSARAGSTHGYDVTDPNAVDPVLGGQAGFERLVQAAHGAGLGIVLDIVPNHMAFAPENPYLGDVLRAGRDSVYADVFDIDWDRGPIVFPILGAPLAELLRDGQVALGRDGSEPVLQVYDHRFPLRAGTELPPGDHSLNLAGLEALIAGQHWRLGHWRDDAHRIVHRRFFNITDLIGVRQEDRSVFELTHRWVFEQIAAGHVDGLRIDHIDGLACPSAYLERLRARAGGIPIWAEKIVKPGEDLPHWPIAGLSGYEFIAPVTRFLTDPDGLAGLREAAADAVPDGYHAEVRAVRRELLATAFRPEFDRLAAAAVAALQSGAAAEAFAEAEIRAAIARLAEHWPVYRSYTADGVPNRTMLARVGAAIGDTGEAPAALARVEALFSQPGPAAERFRVRFEQLTGALTAKSEEDTVFFRDAAYLPFCEVGLDPDATALGRAEFEAAMNARVQQTPLALSTLSTHDTKRSADARAVILALARMPALAAGLLAAARGKAQKRGLPEDLAIYCLQTALIMHYAEGAGPRLRTHIGKALREAKLLSTHEAPDEAVEREAARLCIDLHRALGEGDALRSREEARQFDAELERLINLQVALQLTAPGIPDIYQGTEALAVMLTDPDNRRPVDWAWIEELADRPGRHLAGRKLRQTRRLLALRRSDPELFARGDYVLEVGASGALVVRRHLDGRECRVQLLDDDIS